MRWPRDRNEDKVQLRVCAHSTGQGLAAGYFGAGTLKVVCSSPDLVLW